MVKYSKYKAFWDKYNQRKKSKTPPPKQKIAAKARVTNGEA